MSVLRCKDLRKCVIGARMPFANISTSEFIEHIRSTSFLVDKSLTIVEFLGPDRDVPLVLTSSDDVGAAIDSSSDDVPGPQRRAMIVRPRRFGKTFTLSMINDFLKMGDSEVSERGRKSIFQQTEIWRKFPDFCETNFAQHPVIFASFKVCRCVECVCRFINYLAIGLESIVV